MQAVSLSRMLAPLSEPCLLVDHRGTVLAANGSAVELLGVVAEVGANLCDAAAQPDAFRKYLLSCSRTSSALPGSLTLTASAGERLSCRGGIVQAGERPIILLRFQSLQSNASQFRVLNERIEALNREVRERLRAEERLQLQAAELEELAAELEQTVEALQQQTEEALRSQQEAREAVQRLETLAEAGAVLAEAGSFEDTLQRLCEVAVRTTADFCVGYVLEPDGTMRRVAGAHARPDSGALIHRLLTECERQPRSATPAGRTIAQGEPVLVNDISPDMIRSWSESDAHREIMEALAPASSILVQVRAGEVGGAISLNRTAERRPFNEADLRIVQELARRTALAMDNARLFEQAQHANQAKSAFLATMSHELRTPLNAVVGYADLLDAGINGTLNPKQQSQVGRIRSAAGHLRGIIEEILLFARVDAGKERLQFGRVELHVLMEEVAELMRPGAQNAGLELRVDAAGGAVITSDPARLRQILLNLVSNAIKFTPAGAVSMTLEQDDVGVRILVSDTGVGIPAEHLESIFEPFWQVERGNTREFGGTGLGLTVTRRLTHLLGGDISVASTPDEGSTFTLHLPAEPPQQ